MKNWSNVFVNKMEDIIDSRILLYVGLLFFLGFSTPQFAEFIHNVSRLAGFSDTGKFNHGLSYAVGIEIGVFILASLGKTEVSKKFAIVSGVCQLLSMHRWDEVLLVQTYFDPITISKAYTELIGSIIISVMSPGAIWYFSELIAEKRRYNSIVSEIADIEHKLSEAKQKLSGIEQKTTDLQIEERDASREITILNKKKAEIEKEVTELCTEREEIKQEIKSLQKAKAGASGGRRKAAQEADTEKQEDAQHVIP